MKEKVLIRSSLKVWDLLTLAGCGFCLLFFALLVKRWSVPLAFGVVTLGLAALVGGPLALVFRTRRRAWVRDLGTGFTIIERSGEQTYSDEQVLGIALILTRHHANGVLQSITRRLMLWVNHQSALPDKLEMVTTVGVEEPDPLEGLFGRLLDRLEEQAQADRLAGHPVLGEGWKLDGTRLELHQADAAGECPLNEIVAIDTVDNRLVIWRRGQDEGWAGLPLEGANVYLLSRLLAAELAQRPEDQSSPPPGQLGRIIFERAGDGAGVVSLVAFGAVLLFTIGLFVYLSWTKATPWWLTAIVVVGCGLICSASAQSWATEGRCFRCHEHGVYWASRFRELSLRFADMEAFTYGATRLFYNGSYMGTLIGMQFEPMPDRGEAISYKANLNVEDQEIERLRDELSRMLAARMAERLAAGATVAWTPGINFTLQGLMSESAFTPALIPYENILTFSIADGSFHLNTTGSATPGLQLEVNARNFFPGFYLLCHLKGMEPEVGVKNSRASEP